MTQSRHIFSLRHRLPARAAGLRRNLVAAGASGARRCWYPQNASALDVFSASASASAHALAPFAIMVKRTVRRPCSAVSE